jgi:flavin-dependent dehydrogenase
MTFDPLSSQGLLHALFTGLAAAEAADSYLSGDTAAPTRYQQIMHGIQYAYRQRLAFRASSPYPAAGPAPAILSSAPSAVACY